MKINEVTKKIEPSKPRNFVAKNMTTGGAGAHRDKKKEQKQGNAKHKNKQYDMAEGHHTASPIDRERYTDLSHEGLEGPFSLRSGKVVYYDPKEGKYYDRDSDMYMSHDDYAAHDAHHAHHIKEDGNVTVSGVVGDMAKLSNGQEISAKTLTPDATHPGQFTMPQTDPNAIKPGTVVNTGDEQSTSEELEDEIMPVAPTDGGIHTEHDPDLMGSGDNLDVGGDPTGGDGYKRGYVNDVVDKDFERSNRNMGAGFAGRTKRLGENDELTKMLTIAGLR